jgi:hypothetical protein
MPVRLCGIVMSSAIWISCLTASLFAADLSPDNFAKSHKLILPQANESQWLQIPWLTSIWEAREKAAKAGKPILIWSGGGAAPLGGC